MAKFDIELLLIFEEVYKTGSTTRAAENLGIAQPNISAALNKLRLYFGDILFSRTSKGMEPTPYAQELIDEVRSITASMQNLTQRKQGFNVLESDRTFKISMPDISEVVMLPTLLNYLVKEAPMVHVEVAKITSSTHKDLESGESDLAVGFLPHLDAGYYQQKLSEHNFVCIVAKDHPRIGDTMTRRIYANERHVLVRSSKRTGSLVDKALQRNQLSRTILLYVPNYLSVAAIVANTDCIATVPERYAQIMQEKEKIRALAPPIQFPNFVMKQHWHERFHSDPGNKWLRQVIASLFTV
jgi:DNA-binding transcriptional LysR family regulator